VQGDLASGQGIGVALDGIDVIAHCASSPFRRAKATDIEGTRRLLDAAADEGVGHVVFVSIVGVDRNPFPYYRRKLEAEQVVEASVVPSTIVRAAQFHDLIAAPLAMAGRLPGASATSPGRRSAPSRISPPAGFATHGRQRRVVGMPIPGRAAAAFRVGAQLAPDGDTFEKFLERSAD
jgi:uncharacterized protein YbjT (DUF2867 family)